MTLDLDELSRAHVPAIRRLDVGLVLFCDECSEPFPCTTRQLLDLIVDQEEEIEYMHGDPIITALEAKLKQAQVRLAEYGAIDDLPSLQERDRRVNWHTTCENCANLLDRSYAETMRAEAAEAKLEQAWAALEISPEDCGRIMHESWMRTKEAQGFHRPPPSHAFDTPCARCHADMVPWEQLPEQQKDINRHAFDVVLTEIRARAALEETK